MQYVNPTNDLAFKKVFGSNENIHILAGFIKDFFHIDPDGLTVENPYDIKAYKEIIKDKEQVRMRATISDVAAVMSFADYRSEIQLRKTKYFNERSLYYPLSKFVSRYKVVEGESSPYAKLRSMYSMNVLGYNHFKEDEDALRVFELYDPERNKQFPKNLIKFGYFELNKSDVETENQRQWQNYFLQKPLSNDAPKYIRDALQIIDRANIGEEELEMLTYDEYVKSVRDDEIAYAKEEGQKEVSTRIAIELLKMGMPKEQIMQATKLSIDEVLQIESDLL